MSVKAAGTSDASSVSLPPELTLTLDQGFVGRPVSLDLFEGNLRVAWVSGILLKPTVLRVIKGVAATGTDQALGGTAYNLEFQDKDAIKAGGSLSLSLRASRPPQTGEHPELNVATSSASLTTVSGVFTGRMISGRILAAPSLTVTPAWYDGIMRQGKASWYAYKKCLCAASPDVPKGTRLLVSREDDPSRSVVVTVNDYGPERKKHPDRVIDLDKVAFRRIGNPRGGLMRVRVEVIPRDDPRWKLGDELPPPNWKKLLASLKE